MVFCFTFLLFLTNQSQNFDLYIHTPGKSNVRGTSSDFSFFSFALVRFVGVAPAAVVCEVDHYRDSSANQSGLPLQFAPRFDADEASCWFLFLFFLEWNPLLQTVPEYQTAFSSFGSQTLGFSAYNFSELVRPSVRADGLLPAF